MGLLLLIIISKFTLGFNFFSHRKRESKDEHTLEQFMNHIETLINETREQINEIREQMDQRFNETRLQIDQKFNETRLQIDQKFNETRLQIENTTLILQHIKALRYAESSSGMIIIDPPSLEGNHHACCTLIFINGILYVVTNLHVIYDYKKRRVRTIHSIILYDGTELEVINEIILFNYKNSPDIALIRIKPNESLKLKAVEPLNANNSLGQELFGISNRQVRPVFAKCNVVEVPNSLFIETNCPGTNGSSGTGYLNDAGYLVAIHAGQGSFCNELSCTSEQTDLINQTDSINQTDLANQTCPANQTDSINQTDLANQTCPANQTDLTNKTFHANQTQYNGYRPFEIMRKRTVRSMMGFFKYDVLDSISIFMESWEKRLEPDFIMEKGISVYRNHNTQLSTDLNDKIIKQTKMISKNTRSKFVCSKYIFDLIENKYNNTIILKMNATHYFK